MPNRRPALRLFCPTGPPTLTHPPPTGATTGNPTLTHPHPTGVITGDPILTHPPPTGAITGDPILTHPPPTGAITVDPILTLHLQPEATTGTPTQKILKNNLFASNTKFICLHLKTHSPSTRAITGTTKITHPPPTGATT
jgi:hypothetical protein